MLVLSRSVVETLRENGFEGADLISRHSDWVGEDEVLNILNARRYSGRSQVVPERVQVGVVDQTVQINLGNRGELLFEVLGFSMSRGSWELLKELFEKGVVRSFAEKNSQDNVFLSTVNNVNFSVHKVHLHGQMATIDSMLRRSVEVERLKLVRDLLSGVVDVQFTVFGILRGTWVVNVNRASVVPDEGLGCGKGVVLGSQRDIVVFSTGGIHGVVVDVNG